MTMGKPNCIKESGVDGVALQITKPARSAGLIEETADDVTTKLANVRVFAFNHLLLVIDRERVDRQNTAELVIIATKYTKSIYQSMNATVQIAGNGYQVQLPPASDAGFEIDDDPACHPSQNLICISKDDGTSAALDAVHAAREIVSKREDQVYNQ